MTFKPAPSPPAALGMLQSRQLLSSTSGMLSIPCCLPASLPEQAQHTAVGREPLLRSQAWRWQPCLPHLKAWCSRTAHLFRPARCGHDTHTQLTSKFMEVPRLHCTCRIRNKPANVLHATAETSSFPSRLQGAALVTHPGVLDQFGSYNNNNLQVFQLIARYLL